MNDRKAAVPKARPVTSKFRVRYMTTDMVTNVYCQVYVAPPGRAFDSIGLLTLTKLDFEAFRTAFAAAEFVDDLRVEEMEG